MIILLLIFAATLDGSIAVRNVALVIIFLYFIFKILINRKIK